MKFPSTGSFRDLECRPLDPPVEDHRADVPGDCGRSVKELWTIQSHNAHEIKRVTIWYGWHPFYGQTVRMLRARNKDANHCIRSELPDGTTATIPGWMMDTETCAQMSVGEPTISVPAQVSKNERRWAGEAAQRLGIDARMVHDLLRQKVIQGRQAVPFAPWQIPVEALDLPDVRERVRRIKECDPVRRPINIDTLTMFCRASSKRRDHPSGCRGRCVATH